jgi:hypothetical protein
MAIELKEIQDALESKLEVVSKNWKDEREKDAKGFDEKVVKAMGELKGDFESKVNEIKENHAKEIDALAVDMEAKLKDAKPKAKSYGQAFKSSLAKSLTDFIPVLKSGKAGTMEFKDFNYSDFDGYEPFATEFRAPIEKKYETFHYRNILPSGTMSGEFVKYPRHNSTTGGAGEWTYGDGSKPEMQPQIAPYQADAVWVAGLLKGIPVSMIEDFQWMLSYLSSVGQKELLKAEDLLIQNGGTDIEGIDQVAQAYNGSKTSLVDQIIDASFRQVKDALHTPNGVVLSNADYTDILINKSTGSEDYNLPTIVGVRPDGVLTIAGIPLFANSYLDAGVVYVGDWTTSQLINRSAPRLRVFDQNSDDAEKNQLLIRIEERIALAHFYTDSYVKIDNSQS